MTTGREDDRAGGRFARTGSWARGSWARAVEWLTERRAVSMPVDITARIYERDRSQFGSVAPGRCW